MAASETSRQALSLARRAGRRGLRAIGLQPIPRRSSSTPDIPESEMRLYEALRPRTMTSPEAVFALTTAIRHVVGAGVPGAIVECGVWRGGSMMAAARTLQELGSVDRELYLFDTFEGMSAPTEHDVRWTGESAEQLMATETGREAELLLARATLDDVRAGMAETGYPEALVHYVEGKVEDTLPAAAPEQIALLRLDTDWYESSLVELTHLYPRLSPGGVLILDDYAWWNGVRTATDEYFAAHPPMPLLVRIDTSGARVAVKTVAGPV